jgi:hypothetical protein
MGESPAAFSGANDGASGVPDGIGCIDAAARNRYGVDFVLLTLAVRFREDTWKKRRPAFLGAEFFSRLYCGPPPYKYCGRLLDMIGNGVGLSRVQHENFAKDRKTLSRRAPQRHAAYRIGCEFVPTCKHSRSDDYLKVHDLGKIPTARHRD